MASVNLHEYPLQFVIFGPATADMHQLRHRDTIAGSDHIKGVFDDRQEAYYHLPCIKRHESAAVPAFIRSL
jgi:hypothetical protein